MPWVAENPFRRNPELPTFIKIFVVIPIDKTKFRFPIANSTAKTKPWRKYLELQLKYPRGLSREVALQQEQRQPPPLPVLAPSYFLPGLLFDV